MIWNEGSQRLGVHGGDMEVLDMEYELGYRAAFDLYHHDDVMYCKHGTTDITGMCLHDEVGPYWTDG